MVVWLVVPFNCICSSQGVGEMETGSFGSIGTEYVCFVGDGEDRCRGGAL